MTLDDLRVFIAVCDGGSLSAVARDLGRTQSAVSQHIRRLEHELGLSLLERLPRGVLPTHAGRILYEAAGDSLGGLDRGLRRLRDLRDGDGGSVRIATGATTVRHFMAGAIVTFRARFPDVSLEFRTENSSRACFAALAADETDLGWITIGTPVRGIEQRPVMNLPWVLAVRADDPLADRNTVEPTELEALHHIQLPGNSTGRKRLESQLIEQGVRLTSTTSVADWDTAILLAELGLGHAVVPALPGWNRTAPADPLPGHPTVRLIPIPALLPLSVGWAVRQWDALTPHTRTFAELVSL